MGTHVRIKDFKIKKKKEKETSDKGYIIITTKKEKKACPGRCHKQPRARKKITEGKLVVRIKVSIWKCFWVSSKRYHLIMHQSNCKSSQEKKKSQSNQCKRTFLEEIKLKHLRTKTKTVKMRSELEVTPVRVGREAGNRVNQLQMTPEQHEC